MQEVLVEKESLSGYCYPFKTDHITVDSCKARKVIAVKSRDIALRRCKKCPGLLESKGSNKRIGQSNTEPTARPSRIGWCDDCGKHHSKCPRFNVNMNICSACYQRSRRRK